jgi:hypothetical protein
MHPRSWGDRVNLEHSTDPESPPADFSGLTTEQFEKLAALEEEINGAGAGTSKPGGSSRASG